MRSKKCPNKRCRSSHVAANGKYWTESRGWVQRCLCRACGNDLKEFEEPFLGDAPALGIRMPFPAMLTNFALVALGLPLQTVERLTKTKAETVRQQLLRFRADAVAWQAICTRLTIEYGVPKTRMDELSKEVELILTGAQTFHSLTRASARLLRDPERQRVLTEQIKDLSHTSVEISATGQVRLASAGSPSGPE
jgi:hypothetical protein